MRPLLLCCTHTQIDGGIGEIRPGTNKKKLNKKRKKYQQRHKTRVNTVERKTQSSLRFDWTK